MPARHPGQDWMHGWIPVTASAAKSKNHGRKPGNGSALSQRVKEAATVLDRMKAQDAAKAKAKTAERKTPSAPKAKSGNAKAGTVKTDTSRSSVGKPAPAKTRPVRKATAEQATAKSSKPAASPKPKAAPKAKTARQVGTDSRNNTLREGDKVTITQGPDKGQTATVVGKGRYGAVKVQTSDGPAREVSPANIRTRAHETPAQSKAISVATGHAPKPVNATSAASIPEIQNQIRAAYDKLAPRPGDWVSLTDLRQRLSKDLPRDRVDEALRQLNRHSDVNLVGEPNRKSLTDIDRDAAVHFGGQDKHLIAMGLH